MAGRRTKLTPSTNWQNRIVGHADASPADLVANPRNWRTHPKAQQDALAGVLDRVGWVQDIIVNQRTGLIVDGHLRVSLALSRGEATIPVKYVDLSPEDEALVLASYDPLGALAGRDEALLAALLQDVDAEGALAAMLAELAGNAPKVGLTDPDAVPPVPDEPTTKLGDLWLLGDHRLLCGDATSLDAAAGLFGDASAACLWTDPPYGVSYTGGTAKRLTILNDDPAGLHDLIRGALGVADAHLAAGAPFYIAHPAGALGLVFGDVLREVGWRLHETLIWVKDSMVLGHSDYHYRHEPIFYGAHDDEAMPWAGDYVEQVATSESFLYGWLPGAVHPWYGRRSEVSVFLIDRPKASREHPTMKPVELVERCVRNSTVPGAVVYDAFLGSGTTLIACERLGRRCYAIEIEPRYVDVAVRRWEQYTGKTAVLDG